MEHQPFRMWLVDRSNLNEDEEEILQNHLSACPDCAALERDLKEMDLNLHNSPMHSPREGFTLRFLTSLPERREKEQMRQVKRWMIGLSIALGANLILISTASILTRTTFAWLVNLTSIYSGIMGTYEQSSRVLHTMSVLIPQQVWLPLILVAFAWGMAGVALWVWTMRRLIFPGAANEA
jgi:anti-sigma factor RsiW